MLRFPFPFTFFEADGFLFGPRGARFWGVPGARPLFWTLKPLDTPVDFTSLRILTSRSEMARGVGLSMSPAERVLVRRSVVGGSAFGETFWGEGLMDTYAMLRRWL